MFSGEGEVVVATADTQVANQNLNLVAGGASVAMTNQGQTNNMVAGAAATTIAGGGVSAIHHGVTVTMSTASSATTPGPVVHSVPLFPSAVCAAVPDIIALTDDKEVSSVEGVSGKTLVWTST